MTWLSPHPAGDHKGKAEELVAHHIGKMVMLFPGYAQVRRVTVAQEKWTIDNGSMTPTLKFNRKAIFDKYRPAIEERYKGHVL
jgi:long-chain acyl-CoA synthetase